MCCINILYNLDIFCVDMLELQLSFVNFKRDKKLVLSLDLSDLKL
jgi:hypothetical protein